jgi:hydrogenase expression/formation protein HypE
MSCREGLEFATTVASDTAPLHGLVAAMIETGADIHALRDPTRGGMAATLNEIAKAAHVGVSLDERALPIPAEVRDACGLLGLDPLYVANEGKLLAFVAPEHADRLLARMRRHPLGREAAVIGEVSAAGAGRVRMETAVGGMRAVEMLAGEQLPRIC